MHSKELVEGHMDSIGIPLINTFSGTGGDGGVTGPGGVVGVVVWV